MVPNNASERNEKLRNETLGSGQISYLQASGVPMSTTVIAFSKPVLAVIIEIFEKRI